MIYVIRHGEVNTNVLEQINGWNEEPLNKKGIKQAIEAGLKLKNIHFDVIYCSPLRRTKQTLEYLNLKDVEVIYDERIKERNSNSLVKQSIHILDDKIWYDENKDIVYKDSEDFRSVINRAKNIILEIQNKYQNKNVLIVTHGDICKAIHLYFKSTIKDFSQNNCEIVFYE